MRGGKERYIALLDEALNKTMNDGLMWHRYDFYKRKKKYDTMLEKIGSITDEVQAAKGGIDRVGSNKEKPSVSDRNIQKIFTFSEDIRDLEKERARLKRQSLKEHKGLVKAAKKKVKRVRKFCVNIDDNIVVVYEKRNTIYAEVIRECYQNSYARYPRGGWTSTIKILTDEEWPHLITLIVLLKSGEYLVPNELNDSLSGAWPIKHLS
jgi:hypothetical protein